MKKQFPGLLSCIASLCVGWLLETQAALTLDSLSGPVTTNEINAFKAFLRAQTPPTTPWSVGRHNSWAFGPGGRNLEAMGMMYEISGDLEILNQMIRWADECVSQRNDLMPAEKGGQRVMWTGNIDKTWCPEAPTARNAKYSGCETEDTIAHIVYCAKLILQHGELWQTTVPGGDPFHYGATYLARAKEYVARCDEANDDYFVKWFIQPGTHLIRDPENQPVWKAINNNLNAINRQMMFDGGFQRLAECHEILGDAPERVKLYDAIVKASVGECLEGIRNFQPREVNGHKVYNWHYFPWSNNTNLSESTGHAAYDVLGLYRAFQRPTYGLKLEALMPIANTMAYVIYKGSNAFASTVDGRGNLRNFTFGEFIFLADWNADVYDAIGQSALTSGSYTNNANFTASLLWMKHRRAMGGAPVRTGARSAPQRPEPLPRPEQIPAGVEFIPDVEIGTGGGRPLHVDIYRPQVPPRTLMPAVLWIHGGAWNSGSHHRTYQYQNLATQGYVVVSVEYRLSPEAIWPAQLQDCKLAVRWLRANAATYHVNPLFIGCWGASAGGHLAAMLGLTFDRPEFEGTGGCPGVSSRVQAVVDFCGPSDMTGEWETRATTALAGAEFKDQPEIARSMSPLTYVTNRSAPFLIVHGDKDQLVPYAHAQRLAAAMKNAGAAVDFITVKGGRHGYTIRSAPGDPPAEPSPTATYAAVLKFLDGYLK